MRAYADDTAAVSEDIRRDGPVIAKVFEEFASFSGLELNLDKTVLIPLYHTDLHEVRDQLRHHIPEWNGI